MRLFFPKQLPAMIMTVWRHYNYRKLFIGISHLPTGLRQHRTGKLRLYYFKQATKATYGQSLDTSAISRICNIKGSSLASMEASTPLMTNQ